MCQQTYRPMYRLAYRLTSRPTSRRVYRPTYLRRWIPVRTVCASFGLFEKFVATCLYPASAAGLR